MIHLLAKDNRAAIEAARRYNLGAKGTGYRFLARMVDVRTLPKGATVWKVRDWDQNPDYGTWMQVNDLVRASQPKLVLFVDL